MMMWKQEFLNLLNPFNSENINIDRAMAIKDRNLPKYVYRYRCFTDFSLSDLRNNTVWITSPSKYNDPYDSALTIFQKQLLPAFTKKNLDRIFEKFPSVKQLSKSNLNEISHSPDPLRTIAELMIREDPKLHGQKGKQLLEAIDKVMERLFLEKTRELSAKIQTNMRVCSFTEVPDSIVMWSHYANHHRGYCIEYPMGVLHRREIRRRILYPVIYSNVLFDWTPYLKEGIETEKHNCLVAVLACMHKAQEWEYEREWRFILPFGDSFSEQAYPMPKPTRLLLGARIEPDKMRRLRQIADEKGAHDGIL